MDEQKFHLDGVVKTKNEYTDFDGPLELILQLLSKNKIEIKDIIEQEVPEELRFYAYFTKDNNKQYQRINEFWNERMVI